MSSAEGTLPRSAAPAAAGAPAATSAPRRRLFRKYALLFTGLVVAALLVTTAFDFWFSYQETKAALLRLQQEKALAAAERIEGFVEEIERQIGWTTHAQWASSPLDQRRQDYFRLLRQVPAITEVKHLDPEGREQLKVSRLAMDAVGSGTDFSQSPAFLRAKADRLWFSPVYFRKQSEPYVTMAMAHQGRNAGVTIAEINLKLIWDVITDLKIGRGGYAYVVDGKGRLIAHPDISLVLRGTDLSGLPQVAASLAQAPAPRDRDDSAVVAENLAGKPVLSAHAPIAPLGWVVFVEAPLSEAFAPLYGAALRTVLLLVFGLAAAILLALLLARRMTGPIRAIAAGAERFGAGDFGRRIELHTGDELETLAGQFNRMAGDLQKSYAELEHRVEERTAELSEALEQQTATAEVLGVINSSPGDLAPVFDAILEKAHSLCGAELGVLLTYDGERFWPVAAHGQSAQFKEAMNNGFRPRHDNPFARVVAGEPVVHIPDVLDLLVGAGDEPGLRIAAEIGIRTFLIVPLRKDGALLGAFTANRREVRPFTEKQIALLQNFAAQAVIAMENARLITETREALEQQTATAEVLQVINSSPGDLAPVFDAMLDKAARLCEAPYGILRTWDGERFHLAAVHGDARFKEWCKRRTPFVPENAGGPLARLVNGEQVIPLPDALLDPAYESSAGFREMVDASGLRSGIAVALRKDKLLGTLTVYRQEVSPFSEKQIALLQNFAAQAVIAMENARLITETRERTRDLQESLEYQTAISDVLKVISQSTTDLDSILQTVLDTAVRLCDAGPSEIFRLHGDAYRFAVGSGQLPGYEAIEREMVIYPGPGTLVGRTALEKRSIHVLDAWTDPLYEQKDEARVGQFRTMLGVPLFREGSVVGVIALSRRIVAAFSEKQIALVTTFADQAVIAIENARLLGELRERTEDLAQSVEELKALSEVGQAVSSTLDLRAVLSTILDRSVTLAGADAGAIFRYSRAERIFRFVEAVGYTQAMVRDVRELDVGENVTGLGIAIANRAPLQIPDLRERPPNPLRDQAIAAGYRSVLIVPLVGADRIMGATVLQRRAVGEFPEATVRLMQTLASQSVLAIQNARLFREIAEKSEQLAEASRHKSQFLANMSHELRTPLNAILGYAELLADAIYGELPPRAAGVLERVQNNGRHLLALINDVLDLAKIEAGQLVFTLEDYSLADVVHSVVSATEGMARNKGLDLIAEIAPGLPTGHADARRLQQVLLNLVGNAVKFTDVGLVAIRAAAENGDFVLRVRDTGPGIAPDDHGRIFEEFQQVDSSNTRKKGGTGLGLAISKRMIEMQGGSISVDSELGQGATFRVVLPIRVEEIVDEPGEIMAGASGREVSAALLGAA